MRVSVAIAAAALAFAGAACAPDDTASSCGPTSGEVKEVVDGDTLELASGEKIRYLMVDTPESTKEHECYGEEAKAQNRALVLGKTVELKYDRECRDRFGRLLAYVSVSGREVNSLLVERGFACVMQIPPNGEDRAAEFKALESKAKSEGRGLWAACSPIPCGD